MSYFFLAVLWIAWCALHSLLISHCVVTALRRRYGDGLRYYRIVFNIVSIFTLIPVLLYSQSIRAEPLFNWSGPWRLPQFFLALSAFALFAAGGRHYDLLQFLGVRQVREHEMNSGLTETGELDTSGILGVIRHPWYIAGILIIWARPLDAAALVTNVVLTAYLVAGTYLEEKKLTAEFGSSYREYQERVPMFVPGWKRIRKSIRKNTSRSEYR
jgi:protein-S-isoprenylcysteine O-methyltransferase Ste14